MHLSPRLIVARASRITRLEARRRRQELERELGGYCSAGDLRDFEALLDLYPDGATVEIREILFRQAQARRGPARPGAQG